MDLEELQRAQGEFLMGVLQIEMNMEASRAERFAQIVDPEEKAQMEKLLNTQRASSQARIKLIKLDHEKVLKEKVAKLVPYTKTATKEMIGR